MSRVHSQMNRSPSFGPKLPHPGHVPPLPFLPAPTVYSARHPAGLLHPATSHGVRRVWGLGFGPKTSTTALPHDAKPFEAFPSPAASSASPRFPEFTADSFPHVVVPGSWPRARRVATVCSRPLPSRSTSGLCSTGESVARSRRCRRVLLDAPMGFDPTTSGDADPREARKLRRASTPVSSSDRPPRGQGCSPEGERANENPLPKEQSPGSPVSGTRRRLGSDAHPERRASAEETQLTSRGRSADVRSPLVQLPERS